MESLKEKPLINKQGLTQTTFCGECHVPVRDEKGKLLVGKSIKDHPCFAGCETVKRLGSQLYKPDSEKLRQILAQRRYMSHHPVQQNQSLECQTRSVNRLDSVDIPSSTVGFRAQEQQGATVPLVVRQNRDCVMHQEQVQTVIPSTSQMSQNQHRVESSSNMVYSYVSNAPSTVGSGTKEQPRAVTVSSPLPQYAYSNVIPHEQIHQFPMVNTVSMNPNSAQGMARNNASMLPMIPVVQNSHNGDIPSETASIDGDNSSLSLENALNEIDNFQPQVNSGGEPVFWNLPMTKLLIQSHLKVKKEKCRTKKDIYKRISSEMVAFGYNIPWDKIENKVKKLETSYKNKVDNKGTRQSGASRLDIECEELLEKIYGKKHPIHPTDLIGSNWEQSSSMPDNEELSEMGRSTNPAVAGGEEALNGSNDNNSDENENRKNEKCTKKRKYSYTLTQSENQVRQQHHQENLKRKDEYIELKTRELDMKIESKKKELELKEETRKEFLKLKKMELLIKAQKYKVNLPDGDFNIPE